MLSTKKPGRADAEHDSKRPFSFSSSFSSSFFAGEFENEDENEEDDEGDDRHSSAPSALNFGYADFASSRRERDWPRCLATASVRERTWSFS